MTNSESTPTLDVTPSDAAAPVVEDARAPGDLNVVGASRPTRYSRGRTRKSVCLTERDLAFLAALHAIGFMGRRAASVLFWALGLDAPRYVKDRFSDLWWGGYLTRIPQQRSKVFTTGPIEDLLCVESGLAGVACDAGKPLRLLSPSVRKAWMQLANEDRQRVLDALGQIGMDADDVGQRLSHMSETALAALDRKTNISPHTAQAAEFVAIFAYAATRKGYTIPLIRGDHQLRLTARITKGDATVKTTREPDAVVAITRGGATDVIALESETGSSSRKKIAEKIAVYAAAARGDAPLNEVVAKKLGLPHVRSFRVVFYGPESILDRTAKVIAERFPKGRAGLFILAPLEDIRLDFPSDVLRGNLPIGGDGPRALDYVRGCLDEEVYGVVHGRGHDGKPILREGAFFDV